MVADLHLHSCFSDGTYTPEEIATRARHAGLAALALTDHDSVDGCARARAACEAAGIEFIPGTELTAEFAGHELHMLGYLIDVENARLLAALERFQLVRQQRIRDMVSRLNALQVPIRAESVFALANCRSPGRPHVGRVLVQAGVCSSVDEAFERFLKKHRPAYVPKHKMSALEAIALIQQAGGLAVLAHPGISHNDSVIAPLAEAGLDGLECFHTKHSTAMVEHYLELADRHQLLVTGGSDCHGMNKGQPLIGTIRLPYTHVEELKARAASRRRAAAAPAPADDRE